LRQERRPDAWLASRRPRLLVAGRLGQALEELLGGQSFERHAGESPWVFLSGLADHAGPLIRLAVRDCPHEELEVEALSSELFGQLIEQLRMAGRVLLAELVDGVHQPDTEEVRPDTVNGGAGEPRVVGGRYPLGQQHAWVGAVGRGRLAVIEEGRFPNLVSAGILDLA